MKNKLITITGVPLDQMTMGIFRTVMSIVAVLFFTNSHADEIRKWKDENGKTHYGDMQNAPVKSERIAISESRSVVPETPSKVQTVQSTASEIGAIDGVSAEQIKKCAALARDNVIQGTSSRKFDRDAMNSTKALDAQIKALCPGVGFSCTLRRSSPQDDKCEPFPIVKGSKDFIRGTVKP